MKCEFQCRVCLTKHGTLVSILEDRAWDIYTELTSIQVDFWIKLNTNLLPLKFF